ncbi:YlbF family regulator [Clostridia bacterium OttesenSCG-928-F22]|nr:YlbF family regulator [Clostridia bacterium OttesenSCG-928-F22]
MDVYAKTHELAELIKQSEEYKAFVEQKELISADDTTYALLKEYKKLQLQAQAAYMGGGQLGADLEKQLKSLGELLQFKPAAAEYLMAEHRLYRMMGDVYKTLSDAAGVELDFLEG